MKLFIKLLLAVIAVSTAQEIGAQAEITPDELQIIQIVQGMRSGQQPDSADYYICEVDSVLNQVTRCHTMTG